MSANRTIYAKYHEKMARLIHGCSMGTFSFVPDSVFDEYADYFTKTVSKEEMFKLYRYSSVERWDDNKKEKVFNIDLQKIFLVTNGKQNDVFEGLPQSDFDIHSVEECVGRISDLVHLKSFTETNDNMLMWAHYADSYKGVCIEYDMKRADDIIKKTLFPVVYTKDRRIYASVDELISFLDEENSEQSLEDYKGIFLSKASYWKYENEWRILILNNGKSNHVIELPLRCVSSIYMGPRISKKHQECIVKMVENYNKFNTQHKIKLYTAMLDENKYSIKFNQHDCWEE